MKTLASCLAVALLFCGLPLTAQSTHLVVVSGLGPSVFCT